MTPTPTQAAIGASLQDTIANRALQNPYLSSTRVSESGPRTLPPVPSPAPPAPPLDPLFTPPTPFHYGDGRDTETVNTDGTHALGAANTGVESTTIDTTAARVETDFGSEYNSVYTIPDDPNQILLDQLRPLLGQPHHHQAYLDLKDAQVTFCQAIEKQLDKVTKISSSGYTLRSMTLKALTLIIPTGHEDDTAYMAEADALILDFEAAKAEFQARAVIIVKQSTEQHILSERKRNGKIFLTRLNAIATSGATAHSVMWDAHNLSNEYRSADKIRFMAVHQLLKEGQPNRHLEAWLKIPNLSDLYREMMFPTASPAEILQIELQYGKLIPTEGVKGRVDLLVKELAHYIPLCTYEYTANALILSKFKELDGKMAAHSKAHKINEATAATEQAIRRAAAESDRQASNPKHHPKGKGGQTTSMSKPVPKKGSPPQNSNRNRTPSGGKGKPQGTGSASGNKRKQQTVHFSPKKHPAKNQGNENGVQPPKNKRRRRQKVQSTHTTETTEPSSFANNAQPKNHQRQQGVANQGGVNKGKRRHV
jgi:hypothetical protein